MAEAQTRFGVVGLGYVGLPLALAMRDTGYDVVGVDVDTEKVRTLRDGKSTVEDVTDNEVAKAVDDGVKFTTEYDQLAGVDGVSICVPTPLRKTDTPDLSYVLDAAERLAPVVGDGCTVVLESTVYPGATGEAVANVLAENGATIGENLYLAFSPERIDPGNNQYGPTDIPKVLGGVTDECGNRAEALYAPVFDKVVRVESATEAELVKLLENTFRAVNIGLINELAQIAHELGVDIWSAIEAAETKPFGFMPFYPGPGLGGHCIPIDPFYLSWKADQHGVDTRFIDLADTVNREMPQHVIQRVVRQLNNRGVALSNARILVVGAAYKPDVSDTRESPAIDIISELDRWDADIDYHDPHVSELTVGDITYNSISLTDDQLHAADCVIIVTDHSNLSIDRIVEKASFVFDTRNVTSHRKEDHIVRL